MREFFVDVVWPRASHRCLVRLGSVMFRTELMPEDLFRVPKKLFFFVCFLFGWRYIFLVMLFCNLMRGVCQSSIL